MVLLNLVIGRQKYYRSLAASVDNLLLAQGHQGRRRLDIIIEPWLAEWKLIAHSNYMIGKRLTRDKLPLFVPVSLPSTFISTFLNA